MTTKEKERTVLVTGANGRLGHALINKLISEGVNVRAIIQENRHMVDMPSKVRLFVGDICDHNVMREAFSGKINTVYHLAAIVSQNKFSRKEIMRVNLEGTKRIVEESEHCGVGHIIFPSSVDVYGRWRNDVLSEESELRPSDAYGQSKAMAEQFLTNKCGINYTIFRMAAIYGVGFEGSFFKVFSAMTKRKLPIIGDGQNKLSLVHVNDVVDAFITASKTPKSNNNIYNLSDGKEYTQEYLFQFAASMLNVPMPRQHINTLVASALTKLIGADADEFRFITSNRVVDITKIRTELGFKPKIGIREGGRKLVNEFLDKQDEKEFHVDVGW